MNLSETSFQITLDPPVYEAEAWDVYDEDWYEDIENEFFIMHEEQATQTVTLADGTTRDVNSYIWIDQWLNKEYTRPDVLEFTFNTEGSTDVIADDSIIFSYAQFSLSSDTSGMKQTVACIVQVGNPDERTVLNYAGTSTFTDNDVQG